MKRTTVLLAGILCFGCAEAADLAFDLAKVKVSVRRGEGGRVTCDVVLPTGWTRRDMTLPTVGSVACRWLGAYKW